MFPVMTKKRAKSKCCPFICCAAVEDDIEVPQESRLPAFRKKAGAASMAQLANRLDLNNPDEETMVDPDLDSDTEVTVIFQRPIESISEMDKQIVQMQSAVKCSFMESSTDGPAVRTCLRELFDITKGTYFSNIHDEVIRSMTFMVPQEMQASVNVHTTFSLISSIYEDVLKKMNSALLETDVLTGSWIDSVVPQITDMAKTLLSSTMKKLQDFLEICKVCDWLRASRGSPVDILDELDAVVPTLTRKVVGAAFQSLLGISSEGTSKDVMDCGSDTPLINFLQAVADKIESEISSESATPKQSSCPSDSSVVDELPSSQGRNDFDRKERCEVATCSVVTEKLLSSHRPRSERVLESIIFNKLNQNSDADSTERDTERLFRLSVNGFLVESSKMVHHIIKNETTEMARTSPVFDSTLESSMLAAASGVVSALVSDLKSTFQEDFKLVDPSLDPTLYTTQIQMVSNKVLESIQSKLKEVLIIYIFMRVNGVMKTTYDAQLRSSLLTASRETLKIITEAIMAILRRFNVADSIFLYRRFLWNLQECLIQPSPDLSESSDVSSEDSFDEELYCRPRFPKIRLPKLRFKKRKNRMEATTVLAEDQTQNQPLPTEKPSNGPTSSAAVPKRKTFFSRVSDAFCRVFRKGAKTSA
ncbi:uncharacterized protein LOC108424015 isoform X1 [Pygocentrus nattereri]|uniref:uncharacterized protein LOC108424015 isoform X1 n=2 Tax=Pygocentrus nattereri TaxID=42514 RepID=UPI0018911A4B|nr:uncharacterized protein LOC108424015 isoform X1 [Pygocentrus nattereri]